MSMEIDPELRRVFDEYEAAWIAWAAADEARYAKGVWDKTVGGDFFRSAAGIAADENYQVKRKEYSDARATARKAISQACGVSQKNEERSWKLACLFR